MDAHSYFLQMLVAEGFVYRNIVVSPAEMSGFGGFLSGPCRAGDGRYMNFVRQQPGGGKRQQSQLDGSGKAAGIGNTIGSSYFIKVKFRQAVYKRSAIYRGICSQPVILRQIYYPGSRIDIFRGKKLFGFTMSDTEEKYIYILLQFIGKTDVGIASEVLVNFAYGLPCMAPAVHKSYGYIRMVEQ